MDSRFYRVIPRKKNCVQVIDFSRRRTSFIRVYTVVFLTMERERKRNRAKILQRRAAKLACEWKAGLRSSAAAGLHSSGFSKFKNVRVCVRVLG